MHYYVHGDFYKTLVRIRGRLLSSTAYRPALAGPSSNGGPLHGGKIPDPIGKLAPSPRPAQIEDGRLSPEPVLPEVGAPPASAPQQQAVHAAGQENEAEKAYVYYWSELVSVLGIDPKHALQRLDAPETGAQAQEVWAMLMRLAEHNDKLNGFIEEHKEAQDEALSQAYSRLRLHANGDQSITDALDRADGDVQRNLSVFMLFPENGLLDFLIAGLEQAAAPDDGISPVEQKLLDELRHVRATLREADLSDPQTWTRVGQVLQKVAADQRAQIARFAPGGDKRTLN